jgi:hypothetical protein
MASDGIVLPAPSFQSPPQGSMGTAAGWCVADDWQSNLRFFTLALKAPLSPPVQHPRDRRR